VRPTEPDPRRPFAAASTAEPSSWWPFVAIVLGAIGCFAMLVVHLILDATDAGVWGLAWMAVPTALIAASIVALLVASGMGVREKLAVIPAALLGYTPRERSRPRSSSRTRGPR
jgi:hypothetical protein